MTPQHRKQVYLRGRRDLTPTQLRRHQKKIRGAMHRRKEVTVATSTGPQKADFTRCELKDGVPGGSEYSSTPKLAAQPKKQLPLPAGKQTPDNYPKERIN